MSEIFSGLTYYEIFSLSITIVSTLFIGLSLVYLAKQIKFFVAAHKDDHEWNRRVETQRALSEIRDINVTLLNEKFGYVNRRDPIELDEILSAIEKDKSLQLVLNKLLNFYEGLANGVFMGIYDEDIIKVNRRGPMERELIRCKNYIEYRRHQSSKTAWIGYERLIKKWDAELLNSNDKKRTGKL